MYAYISGKKEHVGAGFAIIDNNGIGYRCFISDRTAGALLASNDENCKLYTFLNVHEDVFELYGFMSEDEVQSFRMLTAVSGVGPRAALAVLSVLSPEKLAMSVLSDDAKAIARAQGVGLKTAQKIIIEIKDKISKERGIKKTSKRGIKAEELIQEPQEMNEDYASEAINALAVLGYSRSEATLTVSKIECDGKSLEAIIREALKII